VAGFGVGGFENVLERPYICSFNPDQLYTQWSVDTSTHGVAEISFQGVLGASIYKLFTNTTDGGWTHTDISSTARYTQTEAIELEGGKYYKIYMEVYTYYGKLGRFTYKSFYVECSTPMWKVGCTEPCGHCLNRLCSGSDGHCSPCEHFWLPPTCTTNIEKPLLISDELEVNVTSQTAHVQFQQINVTSEFGK
jgi:hypothetical protein